MVLEIDLKELGPNLVAYIVTHNESYRLAKACSTLERKTMALLMNILPSIFKQ